MKPTFPITLASSRRDLAASRRAGEISARTDYNFQPTARDFSGRCQGEGKPSFRSISASYFNREARGHFQAEALVFGVIALTATAPVFQAVRGLIQLVRGSL
ncbi:MAG: hypothetical protein ABI883_06345 [Chthoniobacterales bacterium]